MVRSVVLIAKAGLDGWWRSTALGRSDVQVLAAESFAEGYRLLVSGTRDLVVAEDWPGADGFIPFVQEVSAAPSQQRFRVILLTTRSLPDGAGPPLFEVLATPCTPDAFNTVLVGALGLLPRASQRHLIRIHVGVNNSREVHFASGATLQINAGGMLIESSEHLQTEHPFHFTFYGVKELEGFAIGGRVLRREPSPQLTRVFRYVVAFDQEAGEGRSRLIDYLDRERTHP